MREKRQDIEMELVGINELEKTDFKMELVGINDSTFKCLCHRHNNHLASEIV